MIDTTALFHFAGALAMAGSLFVGAVEIMPRVTTTDFFEVQSVTADRVGDTAHLKVSRIIHGPIEMQFTVRIMSENAGGWSQFCKAESGVFQYRPEAVLPEPVTLDWWTDGHCPSLPPGPVRIITTWTPAKSGLDPVTVVTEVEG